MLYHILQKFHSGWAYLVFLLLILVVVNSTLGLLSKSKFTNFNRKVALFGLIAVHTQLLVGLILYFVSPLGFAALGNMSDKALRLTSLEHPVTNLLAIALITVGWVRHKKAATDSAKFLSINLFYALGLLLITTMIPWELWFTK